jgi:hypothetical protein
MNEQEFRKGGAPMKVHADEGLKVVGEETEDGIFIPDGVTLPKMAKDLHEVKQALRQADGQIDQLNVAVNARDRELHALRLQVIQLYEVLTDQEFPADSHNLMPTSEILAQMIAGGRELLNNARDTTNHATAEKLLVVSRRLRRTARSLAEVVVDLADEADADAPGQR